jgi:NAD(P)H-nitrite reductase large subunit
MPAGIQGGAIMSEATEGAILQRDKKTYAIVPRLPMGLLTPEILERMAAVARKYSVPIIKITSGQRIALVGINPEDLERMWAELEAQVGPAEGLCVHYVQACPGIDWCKLGQGDSLALAGRVEKEFVGRMDFLPAKTKIGISGCKMNCAESYLRDIGAFAVPKKGWTVVVGGNSGGRPRIGDIVAEGLGDDDAYSLINRCLEHYSANANKRERMPRFVERTGIEDFKRNVL